MRTLLFGLVLSLAILHQVEKTAAKHLLAEIKEDHQNEKMKENGEMNQFKLGPATWNGKVLHPGEMSQFKLGPATWNDGTGLKVWNDAAGAFLPPGEGKQ